MEQPINGRMGELIARLRREKGLTQKALAVQLHLTDKAVSKWERGLACPDITLLPALAGLLGVSVEELLSGERREELPAGQASPSQEGAETEGAPGAPDSPKEKTSAQGGFSPLGEKHKRPTPRGVCAPSDFREFHSRKSILKKGVPTKAKLLRGWTAAVLTLAAATGGVVCLICDLAINGRLTWSPIPLLSIAFFWLIAMPPLTFRRGGLCAALAVVTLGICPYLAALNRHLPVDILRVGLPMAALGVLYLWVCALVICCCKKKPRRQAGWMILLGAPMQLAVNAWLGRLLEEPADRGWSLVSTLILLGSGLALLLWPERRG